MVMDGYVLNQDITSSVANFHLLEFLARCDVKLHVDPGKAIPADNVLCLV